MYWRKIRDDGKRMPTCASGTTIRNPGSKGFEGKVIGRPEEDPSSIQAMDDYPSLEC